MYNSKQFYLDMPDDRLNNYYISYTTHKSYYRDILGVDIDPDIRFMKSLIRKRKLNEINYNKFRHIIDKAISKYNNPPEEIISLFYNCQTEKDANKTLQFIKDKHDIDPNWEEDWLEKDYK